LNEGAKIVSERASLSPVLALLVLLSACATYSPRPLGNAGELLAPPVASVLAADSAAIQRPFLTPVQLDLNQPLDQNAIAVLAVIANPDLRAMRVRARVADAQAFAARLLPDPTINVSFDHIVSGPDPFDNLVGQVAMDLQALRAHNVMRQAAEAAARQVRLDLAWAEWQVAGQARIHAVRILSLSRIAFLARTSRDAAQDLLDRSLRAAARGDIGADQLQSARLAALTAADTLRSAERDLGAARLELTKLVGVPPETVLRLASAELPPQPLDADRLFAIALAQRLDLKALQAGYASQEAAVHKAVLDQFPTLSLAFTATRDTGGNKMIGPAVGFTLPLWNRNRGGIAVQSATREALRAEYEARLVQTRADIAAAVDALRIGWRQRSDLAPQIGPLTRVAEASRREANHGDLALATAEVAEQTLRDKQAQLAQIDQAIMEQTIAVELLAGVPQGDWTK
jgi:cobalt-zinc-cadmium efflux system outer membrane protein